MTQPRPILIDLPEETVGDRVILRAWRDDDAPALFAEVERSRQHLKRWMPWPDYYQSVDDARAYLRGQVAKWLLREDLTFGIFDPTGNLLGAVGLHPRDWQIPSFEIGYWIGAAHQGKGYVTEAVQLVTTFAFTNLNAQRVFIRCDAENERSANVARRCGYTFEGTFRSDHREPDGRLRDTMFFSRLPGDPASPRAPGDSG